MAFSDALDLRTAVVEAVGDAGIVDVWPRLVSLAETYVSREMVDRRGPEGSLAGDLAASNGLLREHPDVYLYAIAFEAAKYIGDVDRSLALSQLRDSAILDARRADYLQKWGDLRVEIGAAT